MRRAPAAPGRLSSRHAERTPSSPLRLGQARPHRAGPGAGPAGGRDHLHRRHRHRPRGGRPRRPPGGRPDGLPRDPGRAGEDAPPRDPRRHPRRPEPVVACGRAAGARHRADRHRGRQPLPVPRGRRDARRRAGRGDRDDRHRRTGHGAGGREEPRERRRRGRPGRLPADPRHARGRRRPDPRRLPPPAGAQGLPSHPVLRRGDRPLARLQRLRGGAGLPAPPDRGGGARDGAAVRGESAPGRGRLQDHGGRACWAG